MPRGKWNDDNRKQLTNVIKKYVDDNILKKDGTIRKRKFGKSKRVKDRMEAMNLGTCENENSGNKKPFIQMG